jgi:16S rRNA (guanine966-N2)-methyltransferase
MRITAGSLKGSPLFAPKGLNVRPTSDKVRQAIFNVLEHRDFGEEFALEHARVIDLFAGTGALGIEALSRGAAYALLIDNAAEARAALRRNVENLNLTGVTKIWRRDACNLGHNIHKTFDVAFLDPPYHMDLIPLTLASLHVGRWLHPCAVLVVEAAEDEEIIPTDQYEMLDQRQYGQTQVAFLRPASADRA